MAAESNGPIFVIGAAGSGTTLMRLVLDSHDNIAIAQETGFARAVLANEWVPFWEFGRWYERLGLTRDDLEEELAAFYSGLFGRFAAAQGAARWGDKTPFHVWHLPLLARVFPDAVFIATVRHPGAVAHSTRRRMRHPWGHSVRFWVRDTLELLHQGSLLGDRFVLCRYEDLVTQPEPVLRPLFRWLDEPWSDRLLAFHEVHSERGTEVEVEGATRSDRPMDPSRVNAWIHAMDEQRWARLRRGRVAALARLLGYVPDQALPNRPLDGPGGGTLLDGDGVARAIAVATDVRWKRRPGPSLANRELKAEDLARLRKRARGGSRRSGAIERLAERGGAAGRRALHRLPPDARRRVRSLRERARR